ncbi:MAG TPA: T9SS type A sorting domain-containing protein [Pelobium sp.]
MANKYIKRAIFAWLITASFAAIVPAFAKSVVLDGDSALNKSTLKFKDNRVNRPVFDTNFKTDFDAFIFRMTNLKMGIAADANFAATKGAPQKSSSTPLSNELQKPIDNVKVYPNPVSDQLNLSFSLKKEGLVTIKILDVLGNDVYTLLNQKLPAGTQSNKFLIDNKLNTGFYFVRIISGSDSFVKRISVL